MPLSCSCDYDYHEPGTIISYSPDDFDTLKTKRRKRCASCHNLIDIGDVVLKFNIYKIPETEIEIKIHGEDGEIARAPLYLCESCGEIFFNLQSVGFSCIWVGEDMRKLLEEYQKTYKPQKIKPGG